MDMTELTTRLTRFCRAKTGDPAATVSDIEVMPGHAGFSWGFTLHTTSASPPLSSPLGGDIGGPVGKSERGLGGGGLVLRLPPPNVRWTGTADIVRQARIMQELADTPVPVAAVRWAGDDLEWFERPYSVVERLPGDTIRFITPEGVQVLYDATYLRSAAGQVTAALAKLHEVEWQAKLPDWGPPPALDEEVRRWDWLAERTADPGRSSDPSLTALAPRVRDRLLAGLPSARHTSLLHGDYQWSNHLFHEGHLQAMLDWELSGVGESRLDLGWLAVFSDRDSWVGLLRWEAPLPDAEEVIAMYEQASGEPVPDMAWFRALAGYKFALITGLNLTLHRRGRRIDPHWEDIGPSAPRLLERALEVVG
jgi:aminoglycoside phosphotransferase (APT) family kinase protein